MSISLFNGQMSYTEALALVSPIASNVGSTIGSMSNGSPPSTAAASSESSAIRDIISLSAEANAAMQGGKNPVTPTSGGVFGVGTPGVVTDTSSMSAAQYGLALSTAAETMGGIGGSISFTFSEATGGSGNPIISGSTAGAVTAAIAKAKATLAAGGQLPPPTNAVDNFAQIYAQQAADGVAGRFYKGANLSLYTMGLSKAAKTSFMKAFNSRTLDIQSVTNATGVTSTGTSTTSFFAGADGGGMAGSGTGSTNTLALLHAQQHLLYQSP